MSQPAFALSVASSSSTSTLYFLRPKIPRPLHSEFSKPSITNPALSFPRLRASKPSHWSPKLNASSSNAKPKNCSLTDSERWSLRGTTALVTGGTRGIGRAIVEELLGFGARVYTCSRDRDGLDECLRGWRDSGFEVGGSVCDVSKRVQRVELIDSVASLFDGKLNILVSSVGTNIRKPMVDFTAEELSTLVAMNFESAFHISQLVHPLLKSSGEGRVVFVSSVSSLVSLKNMSVLGATKGAINQLTKSLACEWAKDNIRVNAVAPWYVRTSMVEKVLSDKEFAKQVYERTPLGRVAEPNEVSSVVAFLCLSASSYVTAQIVAIDGGMSFNGFYPTNH